MSVRLLYNLDVSMSTFTKLYNIWENNEDSEPFTVVPFEPHIPEDFHTICMCDNVPHHIVVKIRQEKFADVIGFIKEQQRNISYELAVDTYIIEIENTVLEFPIKVTGMICSNFEITAQPSVTSTSFEEDKIVVNIDVTYKIVVFKK